MGFDGPANLLEWILLASGLAAFVIMGLGLQKFFVTPGRHERLAILFQESAIAVAVVHCVGVITRRSPSEAWTAAGVALYLAAIVLFLSAVESTQGVMLPRAFADSEDQAQLITAGVYRFMRHPVYVAYSLALAGRAGRDAQPDAVGVGDGDGDPAHRGGAPAGRAARGAVW